MILTYIFAGELETRFTKSQKELAESKQKIVTLNEELSRLKNVSNEIENERNGFHNEIERLKCSCREHQSTIEKLDEQLNESKRKFDDYRNSVENQLLDSQRQDSEIISSLRLDLDESRKHCQTLDSENRLLREENASLAAKVRELQEDIEGLFSFFVLFCFHISIFVFVFECWFVLFFELTLWFFDFFGFSSILLSWLILII